MQAAGISAGAADDAADGSSSSSSAHGGERIEGTQDGTKQQQLLQHPQKQTSSGVLGESNLNSV